MPNRISDFMRNAVDLDKQALRLGILPRHYTMKDIDLFFTTAADEIDRLEIENGQMRLALSINENASSQQHR